MIEQLEKQIVLIQKLRQQLRPEFLEDFINTVITEMEPQNKDSKESSRSGILAINAWHLFYKGQHIIAQGYDLTEPDVCSSYKRLYNKLNTLNSSYTITGLVQPLITPRASGIIICQKP